MLNNAQDIQVPSVTKMKSSIILNFCPEKFEYFRHFSSSSNVFKACPNHFYPLLYVLSIEIIIWHCLVAIWDFKVCTNLGILAEVAHGFSVRRHLSSHKKSNQIFCQIEFVKWLTPLWCYRISESQKEKDFIIDSFFNRLFILQVRGCETRKFKFRLKKKQFLLKIGLFTWNVHDSTSLRQFSTLLLCPELVILMGFKVIYENVHIFCHFSDVTTSPPQTALIWSHF